jgi:hypothetical protein
LTTAEFIVISYVRALHFNLQLGMRPQIASRTPHELMTQTTDCQPKLVLITVNTPHGRDDC